MLVAQPELHATVAEGRILFDPPLEQSQWGPTSIDLRLGLSFTKLRQLPGITVSVVSGLGATHTWISPFFANQEEFAMTVKIIPNDRGNPTPYVEIPDEVILFRMPDGAEADQAEKLLRDNSITYRVQYRPTYPGRPEFVETYLARPLVTARVGSFKGLVKIKKFIEIEKRIRRLTR